MLRVDPGKLRLSENKLDFKLELNVQREIFKQTKKIKLELVNN